MRLPRRIGRSLSVLISVASFSVCLPLHSLGQTVTGDGRGRALDTARAFTLGELPLRFEENVGQAEVRTRFLARGRGYSILLNSDGVALTLSQGDGVRGRSMAMRLIDSHPDLTIAGRHQSSTLTNYYIGKDPSLWHTNVRSYESVA